MDGRYLVGIRRGAFTLALFLDTCLETSRCPVDRPADRARRTGCIKLSLDMAHALRPPHGTPVCLAALGLMRNRSCVGKLPSFKPGIQIGFPDYTPASATLLHTLDSTSEGHRRASFDSLTMQHFVLARGLQSFYHAFLTMFNLKRACGKALASHTIMIVVVCNWLDRLLSRYTADPLVHHWWTGDVLLPRPGLQPRGFATRMEHS